MTSVSVLNSAQVEEFLLFIQSLTHNAPSLLDVDGKVTAWTPGAEALLGWSAAEIIGLPLSTLYPAESLPTEAAKNDLETAKKQSSFREEAARVRKDGSKFIADIIIVPLRNPDGSLRGFGHNLFDTTRRKEAERRLAESEHHVRSILATVPSAMIVINDQGQIVSFSPAAERMFGYREDELIGENLRILMPANHGNRHDDYMRRYLTTKAKRIIGVSRVVVGKRRDGTKFPMELSVGEAGGDTHTIFTGFMRDLTAQQQAELRLKELQSELIHVSRVSAIGTMASTLAHEINQPLTAIANYLEGARDLIGHPEDHALLMVQEAMNAAAKEALRAGDIIRRLRNFVARREVAQEIVSLPHMIEEAARLALIGTHVSGVRSFFDFDGKADAALVDRVQIQQVLVNLLRNAVEAMADQDRRDVTVSTKSHAHGMILVSVIDNGPGIDPGAQLFQAFSGTKEDGMGLGLSICRTIVEAHGGRIWAEPGRTGGAAFNFTVMSAERNRHHA